MCGWFLFMTYVCLIKSVSFVHWSLIHNNILFSPQINSTLKLLIFIVYSFRYLFSYCAKNVLTRSIKGSLRDILISGTHYTIFDPVQNADRHTLYILSSFPRLCRVFSISWPSALLHLIHFRYYITFVIFHYDGLKITSW